MDKISNMQRLRNLVAGSFSEWVTQRAASKGAALAFYTLFSMAPILVLVIAIAGAVFGNQAAQGEIFNQLNGLLGPTGAQAIQLLLASAHSSQGGVLATLIATIFLLVGATTVFAELKDSLDELWHVPTSRQSGLLSLIRTRLLSFGLVLVLTFLLLVSLVISAALALLEKYWGGLWQNFAGNIAPVSFVFSFLVIASLFATIFKLLPNVKIAWHDVWIGALGTAALFMLGKNMIGLYLGSSGVASSYGAAGSVMALLLWVYYSAQIFFFGAGFTRQYAIWYGSFCKQGSPESRTKSQSPATSG
ncbi:MAG TPA: YihY/virulence factor BrkB family protein [Methylophilaceae bacterium]|nr:YihY/virulence factor BrkB family protein [Methylophilaceae bacterium]